MEEPVLKMKNVSLQYDADTEILRNINLSINKKSFQFLSGASGAGKTSLLKMIYMNVKPTAGNIEILGKDTQNLKDNEKIKRLRKIGIVFQDYKLLPQLTAFDNVALPLRLQKQNREDIESSVQDIIQWVGLKDKIYEYPNTLSGGECQRLAVARAVIAKPDILIADEPTGNVDDAIALQLIYLFEEMHKLGTAVIFATHNYKLVQSYNYPLFFLRKGELEHYATPDQINFKESILFT